MLISVFTPTYNRESLIHRVFDSLNAQSFTDFEWIIIDDGSTDDTLNVVEGFRLNAKFPIKIHHQKNMGKARSINVGLDLAEGELFICFDSDDWCAPNAFERISKVWSSLSIKDRNNYSGISCLKVLSDGSVVGEDYSRMRLIGETYIDRFNRRIKGDKWEIIRTELHKDAPYELSDNERYLAPEYSWLKIGKNHKTIFLNEPLSIVEYQEEGISHNNLHHRVSSPLSTSGFYYLAWTVSAGFVNRLRSAINYVRFCLHGGVFPELSHATLALALFPGWAFFLRDRLFLRLRNVTKVK